MKKKTLKKKIELEGVGVHSGRNVRLVLKPSEGGRLEFIRKDMRTFSRPAAFNAAITLFTSFGYFEDPEEDRQVVANVYNSLKSDGIFLIDVHGRETLARIFREKDWREENGALILEERKVTKNWSWMEARWILR